MFGKKKKDGDKKSEKKNVLDGTRTHNLRLPQTTSPEADALSIRPQGHTTDFRWRKVYINPWTPYLSKVALKFSFRLPILYEESFDFIFRRKKTSKMVAKIWIPDSPRFEPSSHLSGWPVNDVDRCSSDSWILLNRKSGHDRKIDIMQHQNISSILQESSKSSHIFRGDVLERKVGS